MAFSNRPAYPPDARTGTSTPPPGAAAGSHRLRSSIACARCRRSKTKCTNSGAGTTCEACAHSGRECVYPSLGFGVSKRDSDGTDELADRVKRPRVRRSGNEHYQQSIDPRHAPESVDVPRPYQAPEPSLQLNEKASPIYAATASPFAWALEPSLLTPTLCNEIFELFLLHYGADLPFLHPPTLQSALANALQNAVSSGTTTGNTASPALASVSSTGGARQLPQAGEQPPPGGWEVLLLGMLTLTARFHPTLLQYHQQRYSTGPSQHRETVTLINSYYATALRAALFSDRGSVSLGRPDLPRIQALLMLSLHEWGGGNGDDAYAYVGLAIRGAHLLGLHEEDKEPGRWDEMDLAWRSTTPLQETERGLHDPDSAEAFIDEETRRRTWWSCYLLDQCLSSGSRRPPMIREDDIGVQLPCGERAWIFGIRSRCSHFGTKGLDTMTAVRAKRRLYRQWRQERGAESGGQADADLQADARIDAQAEDAVVVEHGSDESLQSRVIRSAEIWGQVARWSCSGGLRAEAHPLSDARSGYSRLMLALTDLAANHPRAQRLTKANIQAHLAQRTASAFTLLHALETMSLIVSHRSSLPFLPLAWLRPSSPPHHDWLPPYSAHRSSPPSEYWNGATEQLFKAARQFGELIAAYQPRKMLIQTPLVAFTLYLAAFCGVYALHFPHMDVGGYIKDDPQLLDRILESLADMRDHLHIAVDWFQTLNRLHNYYDQVRMAIHSNVIGAAPDVNGRANSIHAPSPLREPFQPAAGGHPHVLAGLGRKLRALSGSDDPAVAEHADSPAFSIAHLRTRERSTPSASINNSPESLIKEPAQLPSRQADSWTAVNSSGTAEPSLASPPAHPSPMHYSAPRLPQSREAPSTPAASVALPPLYQLATAAVEDSQHALPPPRRQAQSPVQRPRPEYPPSAGLPPSLEAAMRLPLGGDDVVCFVEGRRLREGAALHAGPGWRGEGWLAEIWGRR